MNVAANWHRGRRRHHRRLPLALATATVVALVALCTAAVTKSDSDGDGIPDLTDNCALRVNHDQADTDGDGVGDPCDSCSGTFADVPTQLGTNATIVDQAGCSVSQRCPCMGRGAQLWQRRAAYLRCIRKVTRQFVRRRMYTPAQRRAVMHVATVSKCGFLHRRPGDSDGDGVPDDGDFDGIAGDHPCKGGARTGCDDNCPHLFNLRQRDMDGNGKGDICDPDRDGDGIPNKSDLCPNVKSTNADEDKDGVGDECDLCHGTSENADVDRHGCD